MKTPKIAVALACLMTLPLTQTAQAEILSEDTSKLTHGNQLSNQPSDASLKKLADVMQFDKNIDKMNQQTQKMVTGLFQKTLADLPQDETLTTQQNAQIQRLMQDFLQDITMAFNDPQTRQNYLTAFIEANKAVYNQQEIDAMIMFYSSAIGQQIVAKQDKFAIENLQRVMAFTQQFQQKLMQEKLPKLITDIETITKQSKNKNAHKLGKK